MPTAAPIGDYKASAKQKFAVVKQNISSFGYWKLGNALDTMIDYFVHVDKSDADDVAQAVIDECNGIMNGWPADWPWTWFDDLGWWVIATNRAAATQSPFSGGIRNQFAALSTKCWSVFTENAPYTWDRREYDTFNQCRPLISGGVWNSYWKGTSTDYLGFKTADPTAGKTLEGIQNTVTNALYLISAQRTGNTAAAERQYHFLSSWLFQKSHPALWWPQNGKGALVRERVSVFADGKPTKGFQEKWAWTGDLGLILGAFIDRIAKGVDPANALTCAKALLTGARLCLVDRSGVLKPSTDPGSTPDHDIVDYATGPGVFWRYLLQAWKLENSDVHAFLASEDYKKFVRTNADAAMAQTADPDVANNQLAALVTGIAMLA